MRACLEGQVCSIVKHTQYLLCLALSSMDHLTYNKYSYARRISGIDELRGLQNDVTTTAASL
jgi:hypothetical protein